LRTCRNPCRAEAGRFIVVSPEDRFSLLTRKQLRFTFCQEQIMARRRSSKETYAQKVVELATSTLPLPTPVKSVAKSRWGSRLLLVLVPILIASGVVTISWTGGMPSITVNKDRAAVVGQEVQQEAIKAAERVQQYRATNYR